MSLKQYIENRQARTMNESSFKTPINEVKFNEQKLEKVAGLYGKIMGKQMMGEFKRIGIENFKRKSGDGRGIRTMNNKGEQLRFNWDKKLSKKGLFELTSIDYWRPHDIDFGKPYRRVELAQQDNVIQVLAKIVSALKTGSMNESMDFIEKANDFLFEAKSTKEITKWIQDNDMNPNYAPPSKRDNLKKAAKKAGKLEALMVFLGEEETNDLTERLNNPPKPTKEELYSDPEEVFNDIEDLTSLVATGAWNSLLVIGDPGVGKTFRITSGGARSLKNILGPEGDKWTLINASAFSDAAFYRKVFNERNKLIVFDESDKLLTSSATQEMLKVLLDTGEERMISREMGTQPVSGKTKKEIEDMAVLTDRLIAAGAAYDRDKTSSEDDLLSGKNNLKYQLPGRFYFTGQMIFIANLSLEDLKKSGGGAFLSRSLVIDVKLEEQDKIRLMNTVGKNKFRKNKVLQERGRGIDKMMSVMGMVATDEKPEHKYKNAAYMRKKAEGGTLEGGDLRALELWEVLASSDLENYEDLFLMYGIGSKN